MRWGIGFVSGQFNRRGKYGDHPRLLHYAYSGLQPALALVGREGCRVDVPVQRGTGDSEHPADVGDGVSLVVVEGLGHGLFVCVQGFGALLDDVPLELG